jgi:AcrR family transcriptional regulator
VKLCGSRGYHATGIVDICDATGIGKASLYHHFESKEAILFEIHNRFVDPMLDFANELVRSQMSSDECLAAISRQLMVTIATYKDYCTIFFREINSLSPERFQLVQGKRQQFYDIIIKLIRQGVMEGVYAEVPVGLTAMAFLGMHNYAYTWLSPKGTVAPERIATLFSEIFFSGIKRGTSDIRALDGEVTHRQVAVKRARRP